MTETKTKERMDFLDIAKGIGGVWMIHCHVVHALLKPGIKVPWYYPDLLHGLPASCFLLCAGFVFIILFENAKKKNEIELRMKRLLYRCGQIILLGYGLQLPYFSLRKLLYTPISHTQLLRFFQANILQCIGLSLILLALFIWALKRFNTIFAGYCAGAIGLLIIFASYWIGEHTSFPIYLQSYFAFKQKSLFPIFPFGGILFFGAAAGSFYMYMKSRNKIQMAFIIFIIFGILFVYTSFSPLYAAFASWGRANPIHYINKIGQGLLALGVSYYLQKVTGLVKHLVDLHALIGIETPFVYAFHLVILYGYPFNFGLYQYFAASLSYAMVTLVAIILILFTLLFTWFWAEFKKRTPRGVRIFLLIIFLIFVFKP